MATSGAPSEALDLTVALEACLGDREFLAEIASKFLRDADRALEQLEAAIRQGDLVRVESVVHQLKGTAGLFGFHLLQRNLRELYGCLSRGEAEASSLLAGLGRVTEELHVAREAARKHGLLVDS